jgi:hypothetical protein
MITTQENKTNMLDNIKKICFTAITKQKKDFNN